MKYGFYSDRAVAAGIGTCFWSKPDGSEVEVTVVDDDPEATATKWADKRSIGEVVKYIRPGRKCAFEPYLRWSI